MTKVKICGITHPDDAFIAANAGADYIGVIFSDQSKRGVSLSQALSIKKVVEPTSAEMVAVFVDQSADEIISITEKLNIKTLQLHGRSRAELSHLKHFHTIFYATHPNQFNEPPRDDNVLPLIDNEQPGSGCVLDWAQLSIPTQPWILAGGLNQDNVASAITLLRPDIIDVASGIEFENSSRKDPEKILSFIKAAKSKKFGGQYLPEILMTPIQALTQHWEKAKQDEFFLETLSELYTSYSGRPTPLTEVENFSASIDGPRVFLKREDLLHTGSHKINNALGQCLLAKKMGKHRIIAETGAGQHGVATATGCARLKLECVVYMGETDIARQKVNVDKMRLLGATVIPVSQGSATLKDAVNEALRDWSKNYETSHYCLGSALGPHPYPEMVRFFQSVISLELKSQLKEYGIDQPDKLIACV